MPCQSILRTFRLFNSHTQNFAINRYASVFRCQKSSFISRVSLLFIPSLYFRTNVRHYKEEGKYDDPDLDTDFDPNLYQLINKVVCVIHEDNPEMPEVNLTVTLKDEVTSYTVKARVGNTVMKAIFKWNEENGNKIPMEAACNGSKACTTCHVYCHEGVSEYFTPPDTDEYDLLDKAKDEKDHSRLSCQMRIMKPFDNIHFELPKDTINFAVDRSTKKKI